MASVGLVLGPSRIAVVTHDGQRWSEWRIGVYESVGMQTRRVGRRFAKGWSDMFLLKTPAGPYVPVGGLDADESYAACSLVNRLLQGSQIVGGDSRTHAQEDRDRRTTQLLLGHAGAPRVAESIRVLRRMHGGSDLPVLAALSRRPELATLSRQVSDELTGVPPVSGSPTRPQSVPAVVPAHPAEAATQSAALSEDRRQRALRTIEAAKASRAGRAASPSGTVARSQLTGRKWLLFVPSGESIIPVASVGYPDPNHLSISQR
jgi:hypothetical protein